MKTLLVILGLVIGTSLGANAQTQTQAKPNATAHPATQTMAQTPRQAPAQTKSMVKITDLAKPIQDNLSLQHKGWSPVQAYKLDTKGVITYEVMVRKETNEMRLFYDNDGKYLREEPIAAMTHQSKNMTTSPKHETQMAPAAKPTTRPK